MGLAPRHASDTRVELRRVNASLTLEELEAAHRQGCQQDDEPPNYKLYRQMVEPNRAAVAFRAAGDVEQAASTGSAAADAYAAHFGADSAEARRCRRAVVGVG